MELVLPEVDLLGGYTTDSETCNGGCMTPLSDSSLSTTGLDEMIEHANALIKWQPSTLAQDSP